VKTTEEYKIPKCPFDVIRNTMANVYSHKIDDSADAVAVLARKLKRSDLAEFIVDAYDRGWITNFHLGLDDDGNIM
jgi:hypothetical protein